MPGRKRTIGIRRTRPAGRTATVPRRRAARSGRRPPSGWVLLAGAAIALAGGVVASLIMVGDAGRLDAGPLVTFGVFAAIALGLALVGIRRLRGGRARRRRR